MGSFDTIVFVWLVQHHHNAYTLCGPQPCLTRNDSKLYVSCMVYVDLKPQLFSRPVPSKLGFTDARSLDARLWRGKTDSGSKTLICRVCVSLEEYTMQVVHAVADVHPGQELGATYIEPFGSRAQRRKRLQDRFGFLCSCPACSLEGSKLQVRLLALLAMPCKMCSH